MPSENYLEEPINICVADDHALFLEGISTIIELYDEITILGTASDGEEALEICNSCKPDVILLDINMPKKTGIEVCQALKAADSKIKVLALTMLDDVKTIVTLTNLDVDGYILKNTKKEIMRDAIHAVFRGQKYYEQSVALSMVENYKAMEAEKSVKESAVQLTDREKEILILLATEKTNNESAEILSISVNTVMTHRKNLIAKLGAKNLAGLVRYAVLHKLIDLDE